MKTQNKTITDEQIKMLGVSLSEAQTLENILKRKPTIEEVVLFCLLWSEDKVNEDDERIENVLSSNGRIAKYVRLVDDKSIFSQVFQKGDSEVVAASERIKSLATIFGGNPREEINLKQTIAYLKDLKANDGKFFFDNESNSAPYGHIHNYGIGMTPVDDDKKLISEIGKPSVKLNLEREENHEPFDIEKVDFPEDLAEVAVLLLSNPNIASTNKLFLQNSSGIKSSVNIDNLVFSLSNNTRYAYQHPKIGAALNIAKTARDLVCKGVRPIFFTSGINASESHFEVLAYFVAGINKIASRLSLSNIAANISINEENKNPSVSIALGGVKLGKTLEPGFKEKGELIFLIGKNKEDIGSSEYLSSYHGVSKSPAPYFDLDEEVVLYNVLGSLIEKEMISSAESVAEGGIFVALTKLSIPQTLGFDIVTDAEIREDAFLFGESSGRVIVSVNETAEDKFIEFMMESGVSYTLLGHVTKGKMVVDDQHFGFSEGLKDIYNESTTNLIK